ncbi:MAG: hypothetical protein CBC28_08300 [Flavobacteriaceae bacterium TMED68]|nr:MAG: hypothetical protein CBC28_08300 [Flavobacteriaceae bacterium TMED68]|tara:strand:- start:1451 stop:1693 length:243 start_codon:yes stop_codon:yes gene_type:complete
MIQSYKKSLKLFEAYDAILVGTGIGYLCSGAFLLKTGKKLLLLELHYIAGIGVILFSTLITANAITVFNFIKKILNNILK